MNEITREMIDAGEDYFQKEWCEGWEFGRGATREMVEGVFRVMAARAEELTWRPIEAADRSSYENIQLWNGERVFVGFHTDGGWVDTTVAEHEAGPEQPQPTHWKPLSAPPAS